VRGRAKLRRFIRLPWRLYSGDAAWVPPLIADVRAILDRRRHPFHRHAETEYFLAWRGREPVGRIAATINHRHDEFHGERAGFFGFFETEDDEDVARALLAAAEAWLRERGATFCRGPLSFSTNEEAGLGVLIDGFEHPPVIQMAHTLPYYPRLLESAGYVKAKDLLAYLIDNEDPPERLVRGVERLQRAERIRIRPLDVKRLSEEVVRIKAIYNSAWERNWGFVPMTEAEFDHLARKLRPVVDPNVCLIAEVDGEPVGFALALPDYNRALRYTNGRLFPFGVLKLLWHRKKIDGVRVLTLGVTPGYRKKGLDAMLYLKLFRNGVPRGYRWAECSWILEDNWEMRRGLERMGARVYKTYRIYEKSL
jgi:GNAT superfamily N-acetyltransferase